MKPRDVLAVHLVHALLRLLDDLVLLLRDDDVVEADGETALGGVAESDVLQIVEELGRLAGCRHVRNDVAMICTSRFLFSSSLMKPTSFGTIWLKITRPVVVSIILPSTRTLMRACRADLAVVVRDDHFVR